MFVINIIGNCGCKYKLNSLHCPTLLVEIERLPDRASEFSTRVQSNPQSQICPCLGLAGAFVFPWVAEWHRGQRTRPMILLGSQTWHMCITHRKFLFLYCNYRFEDGSIASFGYRWYYEVVQKDFSLFIKYAEMRHMSNA